MLRSLRALLSSRRHSERRAARNRVLTEALEGEDASWAAELEEFLAIDPAAGPADPFWKEVLRDRLWEMVRSRNPYPSSDVSFSNAAGAPEEKAEA